MRKVHTPKIIQNRILVKFLSWVEGGGSGRGQNFQNQARNTLKFLAALAM